MPNNYSRPGCLKIAWLRWCLALASFCLWMAPGQLAIAESFDNQLPSVLAGMGVTEHLGDKIPLDLPMRDDGGRDVTLAQYFKPGKPVILSFNYSNCPMLCSLQLTGIVNGLKDVELSCGKDFEFVSVSIDPREHPFRAAQTRQRYFQQYGREGTGSGWHFLVASEKTINALTRSAGVTYQYLAERKEYLHPAVCICITPDGRLSRYLYGIEFDRQTLRLALVEASDGKIGTTLDQILLFCFHYDSGTGKYSVAVRRLMTTSGALTAIILGGYLFKQYRSESRRTLQSKTVKPECEVDTNASHLPLVIAGVTHQSTAVRLAPEIASTSTN